MTYIEKNTLLENVDRGSSVIPLYVYHQHTNKYTLYLHWHNEFEIIYVEKGKLIFTVDTVPYTITTGQCMIINSGQLHSAVYVNNEATIHHALLFDISFLNSESFDNCQSTYINPISDGRFRFPTIIDENSKWGADIIKEIKNIFDIYDCKGFGWEIGVKACLYKIIFITALENKFIISSYSSNTSVSYKLDIIKKTLKYIQINYNKKIYTEDLASEVNMNPQYFCRFFKANIGKTPVDYINEYRIDKAAKLISIQDKKISEICFEVGFDNISYFIRKFKHYKKCTPNEYRRKIYL